MTESKLFAYHNFGFVQRLFFGRDKRSQDEERQLIFWTIPLKRRSKVLPSVW
jgi:hypothetical protein